MVSVNGLQSLGQLGGVDKGGGAALLNDPGTEPSQIDPNGRCSELSIRQVGDESEEIRLR